MYIHRLLVQLRYALRHNKTLQLLVMLGFWVFGEATVRLCALPIPGGIAGMIIVLVLLRSGYLSPRSIERGANWLIAEMLLFFVPAVMAVLDHRELLSLIGFKLAIIIVASTVMVMAGTAFTVEFCQNWRNKHVN